MNSFAVQTIFTAMDKTSGVLDGISQNIGNFQTKARLAFASIIPSGKFLGSLASQVAIGTLAVKGLTAAFNGLKNTITSIPQFAANADAIGKQSQILGLAAEELQRYQYAAKMSNVSQEQLTASFQTLNRSIGSGSLFATLDKLDKGLSTQIRQAKSTSEAFMMMSDAIARESDVAKRAAIMQAAFGKSGSALTPMMGGGAEGLRELMEAAPNIISNRTIAVATIFGKTVTHIKEVIQSFTDTIRSNIVEAITPYILAIKDWLDANEELIKVKIQEFINGIIALIEKVRPMIPRIIQSVSDFINLIKPFVVWILDKLPTIVPIVISVVSAFLTFNAVKTVVDNVSNSIKGLKLLFTSGPMGIIFLVVAALVGLFILLAQKVGGVGEALTVIGQTALAIGKLILKTLISPLVVVINYVMDLVQGIIGLVGLIPGLSDKMAAVNAGIQGYQDMFNSTLALTPDDLTAVTEPYKNARAEFLEKREAEGDEQNELAKTMAAGFEEMIKAQMGTTEAVEGLADSGPNSPKKLRWNAMGNEDFYATQRAGLG